MKSHAHVVSFDVVDVAFRCAPSLCGYAIFYFLFFLWVFRNEVFLFFFLKKKKPNLWTRGLTAVGRGGGNPLFLNMKMFIKTGVVSFGGVEGTEKTSLKREMK